MLRTALKWTELRLSNSDVEILQARWGKRAVGKDGIHLARRDDIGINPREAVGWGVHSNWQLEMCCEICIKRRGAYKMMRRRRRNVREEKTRRARGEDETCERRRRDVREEKTRRARGEDETCETK